MVEVAFVGRAPVALLWCMQRMGSHGVGLFAATPRGRLSRTATAGYPLQSLTRGAAGESIKNNVLIQNTMKKMQVMHKWVMAVVIMMGVMHLSFVLLHKSATTASHKVAVTATSPYNLLLSRYDSLHLSNLGLSRQAFDYAIKGYNTLLRAGKIKNEDVLSIIDFSMPSSMKRLFVINLQTGQLLFNTYVSHGRNSGRENAERFSNEPESYKSSLGFYTTAQTYMGKHGYSLRLEGTEKGINDKALSRGIVMHAAAYVDESLIRSQGYIGRSQGCPAVPEKLHRPIINAIKDGSCLFVYSPDRYYMAHSSFVKQLDQESEIAAL
jgi:hypothetical protein